MVAGDDERAVLHQEQDPLRRADDVAALSPPGVASRQPRVERELASR